MNIEQPRHEPELVPTRHMASLVAIQPATLLKWASRGIVPAVRVSSRCIRFRPDEVIAALASREVQA